MLRHSYDNCKINHTVSQVENLSQTCDRSYDNPGTNLESESGTYFFYSWVHLSPQTSGPLC